MAEDLISWALDSRRSVEERFFVEVILEKGMSGWRYHAKLPLEPNWYHAEQERRKARRLNPAHQPQLTAEDLERALPFILKLTQLDLGDYDDRPVRDLSGLRFLPGLTSLKLSCTELTDLSPIAGLPVLERLSIRYDGRLQDYSAIAECRGLTRLDLLPVHPWPALSGLENLVNLEELTFGKNPWQVEALGERACFPKLMCATFKLGYPLRDAAKLPEMPAIRRLTVETISNLNGLDRFASLEELTLSGEFLDASPIAALPSLTHLVVTTPGFADVRPLARLPELRELTVYSGNPRDYTPLLEAPKLRRIKADGDGGEVNAMELVAINAALCPWDEDFFLPEPRIREAPRRVIGYPDRYSVDRAGKELVPEGDWDNPDRSKAMEKAESEWFKDQFTPIAESILGKSSDATWVLLGNSLIIIYDLSVAERMPELIEACDPLLARARRYQAISVWVSVSPRVDEPEEELEEISEEQERYEEEVYYQKRRAEHLDRLERQYRYELRKEAGEEIDPESFSKPLVAPEPVPVPLGLILDDEEEDLDLDDEDDVPFDDLDDLDEYGQVEGKGDEEPDAPPAASGPTLRCSIRFDHEHIYVEEDDVKVAAYLLGRGLDESRASLMPPRTE